MITVLVGGVGGAKLALGLARVLPPDELTVVVNTADDMEWHGLYVSPDVDTVLYTLSGLANPQTGWGIAGDTTRVLDALAGYGLDPWFRIGDRDLATHIARTAWLRGGSSLTEVVARLGRALAIGPRVLPMSDDPVRTIVRAEEGDLPFQEYFVRRATDVTVLEIRLEGIQDARPGPAVTAALASSSAILLGPSNPFVSIGPILALPGLQETLRQSKAPKLALSPIVGGRALKGPADRMLRQLGYEASAASVARLYADFLDGFVLDVADANLAPAVEALGVRTLVTQTIMNDLEDRERVAREMLVFARSLGAVNGGTRNE